MRTRQYPDNILGAWVAGRLRTLLFCALCLWYWCAKMIYGLCSCVGEALHVIALEYVSELGGPNYDMPARVY